MSTRNAEPAEIICDRAEPLHYRCGDWQGFGTGQVLEVLDRQWADDRALARGSAVHAACACLALGLEPDLPPIFWSDEATFTGYCNTYRRWFKARVKEVLSVEEPARNEKLHYATRVDLHAVLKVPTIVEIKSGAANRLNRVQVHAQRKLDGMDAATKMLLLYLQPDGYVEVPVAWNPIEWAVYESQVIAMWNAEQWRKSR